jgi:hypothetical protein
MLIQLPRVYDVLPLRPMAEKVNWDRVGMGISIACAIHCAVLPVFLTSLPLFGFNIIHNQVFEWSMIVLAFFVGCYALYHGYSKHHRAFGPLLLFSIGFSCLVVKQFFLAYEHYLVLFAVMLIVSAHLLNFNYCRRSKKGSNC